MLALRYGMALVAISRFALAPAQGSDPAFAERIVPLVARYCSACHQGEDAEGDLDLTAFRDVDSVRAQAEVWQEVGEMLDSGQMPPPEADQLPDEQRAELRGWVHDFLKEEGRRRAGDPGPSVLRRLNNAEYTYAIRDLTGLELLAPAAEFPIDGAAGEGFTNAAAALAMSPALVAKYFDAAKRTAEHAVLLPEGLRFSPSTTRRDWTEEALAEIRSLYDRYSDPQGATQVNLQGIVLDTNGGGRLPVERYLAALLAEREALESGRRRPAEVACDRGLSPKYAELLWKSLAAPQPDASPLLDSLRERFRAAAPDDAPAIAAEIARWQQALWKFSSVGHIGKRGGPKSWMGPVDPLAARHEIRVPLPAPNADGLVTLYLVVGDAGDGAEHDFAVWERPRLVSAGRPEVLLRDVRGLAGKLQSRRERIFDQAAACLAAASEAVSAAQPVEIAGLAARHDVDREALSAWFEYLGVDAGGPAPVDAPLTRTASGLGGHDLVRAWVGDDALSVAANASDQHVRIPGNMPPRSVGVHPSPSRRVAVGWRAPQATTITVTGSVVHAHPECGNGVTWTLDFRRGAAHRTLGEGVSLGGSPIAVGPFENLALRAGDLVVLAIGPRDGNHSCDLTNVDLTLRDDARQWNLAHDVSPDILAGNPHADSEGNAGVWSFFSEPADRDGGPPIPAGSLLARWQAASNVEEQRALASEIERLLHRDAATLPEASPDAALHQQLTSLGGPLLSAGLSELSEQAATRAGDEGPGLDPTGFGRHPDGSTIDAASLCVQAPSVIEVRLPGDWLAGAEFVSSGSLHAATAAEASVQMQALAVRPADAGGLQPAGGRETIAPGRWTDNNRSLVHETPILARDSGAAWQRFLAAFDEFRRVFPAALCYTKIVPVDEVVTLTLFHREDEPLRRLMLSDEETARLERLWDELRYVSQDALTLVDAFEQLYQFATQDADPAAFEPLRQPIEERAAEFRRQLTQSEPSHIEAVVRLAESAYRRPIRDEEARELRALYSVLRSEELPHEAAVRLLIAKVLVSPAFLYRIEAASGGEPSEAFPALDDWELASRLSFFLSASLPDAELRAAAAAGRLRDPAALKAHARRLLGDAKVRRLAAEFGCQWLHVYDFATHDEKSDQAFPQFADLRGAMHEEAIAFLADWFRRDGSLHELLDADHSLLNEPLARHYGLEGVQGPEFRRVEGLQAQGRGGVLGFAAALSKQSGASRTSPILRGNWVCEVLLGEKLPKPPAGVPPLPEAPPEGLNERRMTERHTTEAACAKCHLRIDPFGFALEGFDAIGRRREADTRVRLPDGAEVEGLAGLRQYLLTARRDDFVRQFCRKLLGYALGRAVQLSDEPLLEEMLADLAAGDYRVGVAVERIVASPQFRRIRASEPLPPEQPKS